MERTLRLGPSFSVPLFCLGDRLIAAGSQILLAGNGRTPVMRRKSVPRQTRYACRSVKSNQGQ